VFFIQRIANLFSYKASGPGWSSGSQGKFGNAQMPGRYLQCASRCEDSFTWS